jgi:pyrroline-5-carboxylate reductase
MKIAIIGCGNMGMAFAKSFLQYNLVSKENLLLIEKSQARGEVLLAEKQGVVVDTISPRVGEYDLVILSVKPQDFASTVGPLAEVLRHNQVVLSIMAGISIAKIQHELNHPFVIRPIHRRCWAWV